MGKESTTDEEVHARLARPGEVDLRHHGDRETAPGLVDLAVNVRPGTPPPWLAAVLQDALVDVASYPNGTTARDAVAARHARPPEEVLLTAGAAEAFVLIARTLPPGTPTVVVHPQFTEPEAALRAAGHRVHRLVLTADDGFQLDPRRVPDDARVVVLGNPTNPTSVVHPAAGIAALARPGRLLVVDEAFADTVPGERESLAARRDLPGLVVVRSLTKTWGLAGLRVGYVLAAATYVERLAAAQPLWPVSAPALAAATACSSPAALAEADAWAHSLAADRADLVFALRALGLQVPGEPASSFVLVRVPAGSLVRAALRARGFAVRRGDTFVGLGPDWLRLAVRPPQIMRPFLEALAEALAETPAQVPTEV